MNMSEERVVNVPLLRKAVEWAEAEAAKPFEVCQWYQSEWVVDPRYVFECEVAEETGEELRLDKSPKCGTCYCIAGYVGALQNEQFATGSNAMIDGEEVHVERFATDALGLTERQANRLFAGDNTIEDVRRIAEEIAGEKL